jgi:hypothetical protein
VASSINPQWVQRHLDLLQVERAAPSLRLLRHVTPAGKKNA